MLPGSSRPRHPTGFAWVRLSSENRGNLRATMARARHTQLRGLDELLRAKEGDAGCKAGAEIMDAYVELELAREDPARAYPGTAIHLESCPGCRADHDGLLEAARRFAEVRPY